MLFLFFIIFQLHVLRVFAYETDYMRPKIDPVDVKTYEKNFGWAVGIFKQTYYQDFFICQGALINPKIVLAPGLCIRKNTRLPSLRVRNYNLLINDPKRDFTEPLSYIERNVDKIFYHWKSVDEDFTNAHKRNLLMMVLDIAFIYYPLIGILQPSMEKSVNYNDCLLVSLFDTSEGSAVLKNRNVTYMEVSRCQSKFFIEHINDAVFPETSESTLCAAFHEPLARPLTIGSTLICRYNEDPATLFLTGMLLQQNQYWSKHVKLEDTVSWINETLNEYKVPIKLFTE